MGISGWTCLLVYKWDDLRGEGAKNLAAENEDVPGMQSISILGAFLKDQRLLTKTVGELKIKTGVNLNLPGIG